LALSQSCHECHRKSNNNNRTIFADSNENNNKSLTSSSSWLDITTSNNASFIVYWEVMCGCVGAGVDADKDG
jgi:hypothetical protein